MQRVPTLREQAELTALRVLDEYQRSGSLPAELVREIQLAAWKNGRAMSYATVERELERRVREWSERLLAEDDAKKAEGA